MKWRFLRKVGIRNVEVGIHSLADHRRSPNYAASVYLGDLLVTCYSFQPKPHFWQHDWQRYSVRSAQLEMNMVAEGYYACKCIHAINGDLGAEIPIAETCTGFYGNRFLPVLDLRNLKRVL